MSWVAEMSTRQTYIDRATLFWLRNLAQGLSIPAQTLSVISKWRSRFAHVWSAADRQSIDEETEMKAKKAQEEGYADRILRELQETYSLFTASQDGLENNVQIQHALKSLSIFDDHIQSSPLQPHCSRIDESVARLNQLFEQISNRDDNVIDDATTVDPEPTTTVDGGLPQMDQRATVPVIDENIDPRLNAAQNRALLTSVAWLNANERYIQDPIRNACPESLKLHISGQAGSGKSFFVRSLTERIGAHRIACTSFMGVAASNLPRGVTINTEFAIAVPGGRAPSLKKKAIARAHLRDVRIIIIGWMHTN